MSSSEIRTVKELPPGKVSHVQGSPLWKPILRHGLYEKQEANQTTVQNQVFKKSLSNMNVKKTYIGFI